MAERDRANTVKFIERLRADMGDEWEEMFAPYLSACAEDTLRMGGSLSLTLGTLARLCTDDTGKLLVPKRLLKRAAAEGFADFKRKRLPDRANGVSLFSAERGVVWVPSTTEEHSERLISEVENWGSLDGYGFGITELDWAFGGLYPSEILALVGAPGSMKTTLALNAVDDFLEKNSDGRLLFFSLDMPAQTIVARRLMRLMNCFQSELYQKIKHGDESVKTALKELRDSDGGRFRLIGKPRGGGSYSWEQVAEIAAQTAPDLIIVDYLTLIGAYRSELEAVYDLVPKIKSLAEDLGVAVILLSQMGRSSRAAQKNSSGGHAAGGHYVEDAADVEIELLKEEAEDGRTAIVATVTKTRKAASGKSFALEFNARRLSFGCKAERVSRVKPTANVFNIN